MGVNPLTEPLPTDKVYTCVGCGLHHKLVEAGGIWYCPNILCSATGNAHYRAKLKSYREEPDSKHSVDWYDWIATAFKDLGDGTGHEKDDATKVKILETAQRMIDRLISNINTNGSILESTKKEVEGMAED